MGGVRQEAMGEFRATEPGRPAGAGYVRAINNIAFAGDSSDDGGYGDAAAAITAQARRQRRRCARLHHRRRYHRYHQE